MRTKLWRDSLENEAVESWSFRVRFLGRGTLYVQIPGEWHIRDESRVPPQGFFSGVSGAVIRPLSQWQIPTFFPNSDQKIPNQKVIFM